MTSEQRLGARIMAIRDDLGISGTELAKRAGISPTSIYKLENGAVKPRGATLRRIARALGMTVEELTGEVPKGASSPLERAALQASRLERQEAEGGKGDAFWLRLHTIAGMNAEDSMKLLREFDNDVIKRREVEDLLMRFITLSRRAQERWLALYGTSFEEIVAEDREKSLA